MATMESSVYRALSHPHRRQLLDALRTGGELTLVELCSGVSTTRQSVSKHLRMLEEADLVSVRREGRTAVHSLRFEPLRDVASWLSPYVETWSDRLDVLEQFLDES